MMHFRKQSIADSVMERISAIAASVRTDAPLPAPRGPSTINMTRQDDGSLLVTKTFENGETELLTINTPPEFTDITPQPGAEQSVPGEGGNDIVQAAALGGDSLNALLS